MLTHNLDIVRTCGELIFIFKYAAFCVSVSVFCWYIDSTFFFYHWYGVFQSEQKAKLFATSNIGIQCLKKLLHKRSLMTMETVQADSSSRVWPCCSQNLIINHSQTSLLESPCQVFLWSVFSTASRYSRCWKRTKEGGLYWPYQHLTPVISQPLEAHTHLNTMPMHTHNTQTLVSHYMKSAALFLGHNIWTIYRMYLMHCKFLWATFRNP